MQNFIPSLRITLAYLNCLSRKSRKSGDSAFWSWHEPFLIKQFAAKGGDGGEAGELFATESPDSSFISRSEAALLLNSWPTDGGSEATKWLLVAATKWWWLGTVPLELHSSLSLNKEDSLSGASVGTWASDPRFSKGTRRLWNIRERAEWRSFTNEASYWAMVDGAFWWVRRKKRRPLLLVLLVWMDPFIRVPFRPLEGPTRCALQATWLTDRPSSPICPRRLISRNIWQYRPTIKHMGTTKFASEVVNLKGIESLNSVSHTFHGCLRTPPLYHWCQPVVGRKIFV